MTYSEYIDLKQTIEIYMDQYYNQNASDISDYEYDQLMQRLKAAEREHPEWVTADSPSQKIGGTAKREAGVKVTHRVPMLSIEDVFTLEDVTAWVDKVHERHPDAVFSVETKIDGLSMTLRYSKVDDAAAADDTLTLTLAETRGDGLIGEDVTLNAKVIPGVQHAITLPEVDYLELRGEVYMTHADFDRYNETMEALGKKTAANPRNLAAGTLRQLDPTITRDRGLSMFVFNVQDGPISLMTSHTAALDALSSAGITTVYHKRCETAEQCLAAIAEIGEMRGDLPYDIDGAVVKIDQIAYRNDFPAGSKYSSGHIAYKYPPEEAVVTMDEIRVDVGRTGKLTFTGVFHDSRTGKPARLAGTSVSRATLHNQDYISDMQIGVGGEYKVYKSGEIIPRLNGCVTPPAMVYKAPDICPVCGQPLVREEDTADIRCVNPACPAQLVRTISYFTSKDCMNIMGLGEKQVDRLITEGYLHSYADIYLLKEHRDALVEAGTIGKDKNTDKLLANIEASKANEPERLLTGLGIRNVGRRTARTLLQHYDSIDALAAATVDELQLIPDVGATTAEDIAAFFHNEEDRRIVEELKSYGVNMTVERKAAASAALAGSTFVITGTLPTLGRRECQELIEANGGKCTGSVSKRTTYLVAGEAAGSKLTKAQDLGITILTEAELLDMIG